MPRITLVIITLWTAIVACEDTIEWEVDQSEVRLVVEGRITDEHAIHQIKLSQTSDYFNPNGPVGVSGAVLTVTNDTHSFDFIETDTKGLYESTEAFAGGVGETYLLTIDLLSPLNGSATYTAQSTMMVPMILDSIHVDYDADIDIFGEVEDSLYFIRFFGKEPDESGNHFLFEVSRNGLLWSDTIDDVGFVSDDFINGIEFEDFEVYADEKFEIGDEITLSIYSIEKAYYDFLNEVNLEIDGTDPLGTSGPPANVKGNISNGGIGFFYASAVVSASAIIEGP